MNAGWTLRRRERREGTQPKPRPPPYCHWCPWIQFPRVNLKQQQSVPTWYLWRRKGFERAKSLELLSWEYSLRPPIDACHTPLPAIAPRAARSSVATSVPFGCLPFTRNEPLALKRRGSRGPKCPLAANSPLLPMVWPGRAKLPTFLQFHQQSYYFWIQFLNFAAGFTSCGFSSKTSGHQ